MGVDPTGEWVHLAVGAAIGGVIGFTSAVLSSVRDTGSVSILSVLIGTATGALGGVISASGVGVIGQIAGSATLAAIGNAGQQLDRMYNIKSQDCFDYESLVTDTAIGACAGALGGKGASYGNSKSIYNSGKKLVNDVLFKGKSAAKSLVNYSKAAHRQGGDYVFKALNHSMIYNAFGAAISTIRGFFK